jgi:hypothetical protein
LLALGDRRRRSGDWRCRLWSRGNFTYEAVAAAGDGLDAKRAVFVSEDFAELGDMNGEI